MELTSLSRSNQLVNAIRHRIVQGDYPPGVRLPTFQEIEATYGVSRGVAQMAIEQLKKDGFVDPASRQGLFVAHHPPHLYHYGIAFSVTHGDPTWSVFDEVLVREARLMPQTSHGRDFEIFPGTADVRENSKVLNHLRKEILKDRLAGLILTPGCMNLLDRSLFSDLHLPTVSIYRFPDGRYGPIITGDNQSLIRRSLQYLADRGCRRVAAIRVQDAYSEISAAHFQAVGLPFKPQWLQVIGRGDTAVINTLIPLLMDYPADQRPDGLFVLDDNIVDHVTSSVISLGLQFGKDVHMVEHTNWPNRSPNVLPIRRIGYHIGDMLRKCVEAIDMQRAGQTPADIQYMPALFENELNDE